jgi:hypothetical protein
MCLREFAIVLGSWWFAFLVEGEVLVVVDQRESLHRSDYWSSSTHHHSAAIVLFSIPEW